MLGVVGVLLVGGGLAASEDVRALISSREVHRWTLAMRAVELPEGFEEWGAACGFYGMRCAGTQEPPLAAVETMAERLRESGLELPPARCGQDAQIDPGTTLAAVDRADSQCTTSTELGGARVTVAAWDHQPAVFGGEALPLGRTALVVEWDTAGVEKLLQAEPKLAETRFADVRITPEEIAALPGALADVECIDTDVDGCLGYEGRLEGPGQGPALVEHWAREVLAAEFLVIEWACHPDHALEVCGFTAEKGRAGGELTRLTLAVSYADGPDSLGVRLFTG